MARAALPHMLAQRHGRIIGISPAGPDDPRHSDAVSAVQFDLTARLAEEVAGRGVTVNCITPGEQWPLEPLEDAVATTDGSLRRLSRAAEVTRLAMLLASPQAGDITGQVYSLDGGLNLCVRPSRSMTLTKRSSR
ncbi:MAG: SDR family oxidoreductase [Thermoleophilia bacterium]